MHTKYFYEGDKRVKDDGNFTSLVDLYRKRIATKKKKEMPNELLEIQFHEQDISAPILKFLYNKELKLSKDLLRKELSQFEGDLVVLLNGGDYVTREDSHEESVKLNFTLALHHTVSDILETHPKATVIYMKDLFPAISRTNYG